MTDLTNRNVKIVIKFALTYLLESITASTIIWNACDEPETSSEPKICSHHINNLQRHDT